MCKKTKENEKIKRILLEMTGKCSTIACGVLGILSAVLGWLPLVGWLLKTVFSLLGLYCVAGIILAVLNFVKA